MGDSGFMITAETSQLKTNDRPDRCNSWYLEAANKALRMANLTLGFPESLRFNIRWKWPA